MLKKIFIYTLIILSMQMHAHKPEEFLQSVKGSKTEGKKIYEHFCANCHAQKPLIAIGAPRIGIFDDWRIQIKTGKKGIIQHVEEGYNAMPAMGGCFECTDKQLLHAIDYLLNESGVKFK